jgi:hypothetical protein
MLAVEKAQGQIWLRGEFLCEIEYEISALLKHTRNPHVQRITLTVPEEHCAVLLDAYELILVMADGQHHHIPRPMHHLGSNYFECYVESLP